MVLHQRQPYSVLVAVMFEPFATCADGDPSRPSDSAKSSFAHHVTTLSKRAGRGKRPVLGGADRLWVDLGAEDTRYDLFEKVYICLYDDEGACRFFDVEESPPRNGRPTGLADALVRRVRRRGARGGGAAQPVRADLV